MSHSCITDEVLLASYLDGTTSEAENLQIRECLSKCNECRELVAHLSSLMEGIDESEALEFSVPAALTQKAMSLFDTHREASSPLSIAIAFVGGLLKPLQGSFQPTPLSQAAVRGDAAQEDELAYHVTLGSFSLSVELNSLSNDEIELCVQPRKPVPPGWTIRIIEGEHTRTVSSFSREGIQVSALGEGVYTVALEHQQTRAHQFHLRVVAEDLN